MCKAVCDIPKCTIQVRQAQNNRPTCSLVVSDQVSLRILQVKKTCANKTNIDYRNSKTHNFAKVQILMMCYCKYLSCSNPIDKKIMAPTSSSEFSFSHTD